MKAMERESSDPLDKSLSGIWCVQCPDGDRTLKGEAPPMCVPYSLEGGRGEHLTIRLTRKHCHVPTSQAPDSPATEVLHGLWVHGRFTGRVGSPPEKQTT